LEEAIRAVSSGVRLRGVRAAADWLGRADTDRALGVKIALGLKVVGEDTAGSRMPTEGSSFSAMAAQSGPSQSSSVFENGSQSPGLRFACCTVRA
jgi:hypothetical protein